MNKIICPTDFSDTAFNAILFACNLAKEANTEVELLHIMHVPVVDVNSSANVLNTLMDTQKELAEGKLNTLKERVKDLTNVEVATKSHFGLAVDTIVNVAKEEKAHLIVMGTNGISGVIDQVLGTVSLGVSKRSNVPVLVVPGSSAFTNIDRIAFADDHKESLNTQLEYLYKLTSANPPKIDLVSVQPQDDKDDYVEEIISDEGGVKKICVWAKTIQKGLNLYADKHKVNIISVKRHHRGFFEDLFHHSITKDILNNTIHPILIFN